jgi:hypothetical protein
MSYDDEFDDQDAAALEQTARQMLAQHGPPAADVAREYAAQADAAGHAGRRDLARHCRRDQADQRESSLKARAVRAYARRRGSVTVHR